MASEKVSRKMVLEIKYVNANNAVIHTENSKLLLDLNCSPKELEKTVVNSCGIEHSAAKRGFSDHSIELYYVDHVEPGNPKKAAFILRTDETIGMLRASESHSLFVKLGFWQKLAWELGFGPNLGWELGFGTPLHDPLKLTFRAQKE